MSKGSFAVFFLCLVNAIAGSSRFQDWDYFGRQLRHASCPSCRRERPDALVSWDSQPRREYEFEAEPSPWQGSHQSYRSGPYGNPYSSQYNAYDRAIRSRGAFGVGRGAGGAGRRENPFTIGRDLDFDVAPAQTSVVRGLVAPPASPYQPNFPYSRISRRTQYRKPSFYDDQTTKPLMPANRFADFGLIDNEPGFVDVRRSRGSYGNPRAVFGTDKYLADSFEEGNPMMEPEQNLRQAFPYGTGATGARMQEAGQFPQRRDQPGEPRVIYRPEVKRKTYNRSPDLNPFKVTQYVARQAPEIVNDNRWQSQLEDRKKEPEIVLKNEENQETEVAEEINVSESDDGERVEEVKEKRHVRDEDDRSGVTLKPTTERSPVIMTIPPLVMP
ncbi:uncharacterized protein LOC113464191 [Ceratina calcarata]|uniref:Uncharacterized protein LOC113464191 n=1 Tax=Ceratina calcarata TaxID=156304 RepID=A0AAJ7RZ89_9HYME|nr:uncharacterized protein LOC113464191 [Ceratina calcarata]